MVELIQNTNFSIQFVLEKINTNESKKAEEGHPMSINQLEGFEAKDITGGSAFMSTILRLALHWKEPEEGLPNSIIMKVPSPQHHKLRGEEGELDMEDPLNKDMVDFLMAAHTKEIRFYQLFPRLESGLRLPKFFYGYGYDPKHSDGLILMEDLTPRGTTIPVLPGFSDAQVLDLLTEVARVHAVSWRFPGWEKEIGSDPISLDFLENMRVNALKLLEFNPVVFRPLLERLLPLFKVEYCARSNYSGSKYGFPACIVHGDLWTPNVIWEKNSQDEPTDRLCAIIDWQTIHAGNPCEDLHRILSLNTSGQYRRQNEERLLHFYADKVAQFMDREAPFTLEQLRDAYKNSMQFSAMYFCFGVAYYHEMPSIIGIEPGQKERKQEELLERCRMFLEDTCKTLDEL